MNWQSFSPPWPKRSEKLITFVLFRLVKGPASSWIVTGTIHRNCSMDFPWKQGWALSSADFGSKVCQKVPSWSCLAAPVTWRNLAGYRECNTVNKVDGLTMWATRGESIVVISPWKPHCSSSLLRFRAAPPGIPSRLRATAASLCTIGWRTSPSSTAS